MRMVDHIRRELLRHHEAEAPWCLRGAVTACLYDPTATAPDGWRVFAHNGPLDVCLGCDLQARCRKAVHAEMRALMSTVHMGVSPAGMHMMVTTGPCYRCAQLIVLARVTEVHYLSEYREAEGLEILQARGVKVYSVSHGGPVTTVSTVGP
jgi:deoxycytidylate deaminase